MRPIPQTDSASGLALATLISAAFVLFPTVSLAASFNLTSNSTTPQTLGPGSGQTGTINAGVSLTVSGSSVAVTITGNNATLDNQGSLLQLGTGRDIRDNTGVTGLTVNNGSATNSAALMRTADADVIQMNKANASVTLNNYGTMNSLNASAGGSQAVDFNAITSGANIINNYSTGLMLASQADGVRPGVNGEVYNWGTIRATSSTGSSSDGIDMQTNSGLKFINYSTGILEGARHGVTGGAVDNTVTWTASITNQAGGTIKGNNGSGINLDGFNNLQTVTVINGGVIIGNGVTGDGDGIDVDGIANITNTGTIQSLNAFSSTTPAMSEGITIGGGTVINSGVIEGLVASGNTNAFGRGITFAGNDITSGPLTGTREAIYGNASVINQSGGLIKGQSDSAIAVEGPASGYTVSVINNAGATLLGGSATAAAVLTGADNDTITDAGLIDGSSSGVAIDMGAGNNALHITGGSAVVKGSISGGAGGANTMTIDPGIGNSFGYSGVLSNFNLVEVDSGLVTLSGASTYTGTTTITGGTLVLDGVNRLFAGSSLDLDGGTLETANGGGANAETLGCLELVASSNIDLDFSSMTFGCLSPVGAGAKLNVIDYDFFGSTHYAFRFAGDLTSNNSFQTLVANTLIDNGPALYSFDGTYTDVFAATPEPATISLLTLGFTTLFLIRRYRRAAR